MATFDALLTQWGLSEASDKDIADSLDRQDPLKSLRSEFYFPAREEIAGLIEDPEIVQVAHGLPLLEDITYLVGNSLGLQPRTTSKYIEEELEVWRRRGVTGHFSHPYGRRWMDMDISVAEDIAEIVGALPSEVACMNTLTGNLHTLLTAFYRPTKERYKILFEAKAFPSDAYAFASHVQLHGLSAEETLLPLEPRKGEQTIRTEDILSVIEKEGDVISVICFGAVQYYTGQWFDMKTITDAGHAKGCIVGFDCAHAAGNVPLELHDWGVDFACWCTYKYLNTGPGGIGGLFVHQKWGDSRVRLAGWWGHDRQTRFTMPSTFKPLPGAAGWQHSNPSFLDIVSLDSSLQIFKKVKLATGQSDTRSIEILRAKSLIITGYLEWLLKKSPFYVNAVSGNSLAFTLLTPSDPQARGCQLSLLFNPPESMDTIYSHLQKAGVLGDERRPGVIRLAPTPLYNTFNDCYRAVVILNSIMGQYDDLKKVEV